MMVLYFYSVAQLIKHAQLENLLRVQATFSI